jgi:hypothetical protein
MLSRSVPDVRGDHEYKPWLMRVTRLSWREGAPDFTTALPGHVAKASSLAIAERRRYAASDSMLTVR